MPELPEVNTFQRYFDSTSLHQQIAEVKVHDDHIIRNISGEVFAEKLSGRTFTGSYRQGKYFFGNLDNGHSVLLHFGMTGDIKYYSDESERPRHERFAFYFDNGFRLGFDDPRKFAKIRYLEDREAYIQEIGLGTDALRISEAEFLELTQSRKGILKNFLLNQSHIAGVGNLYADEICYQTRIHPASRLENLSEKHFRDIFRKMQDILQFAVEKEAHYKQYPNDWLWKWRDSSATAPDGTPVESAKIAGRTTYFFPGWQRKY